VHFPPWQLVEQQSAATAQASPSVLQALAPGSAWQVVLQRPVQHSVPAPQLVPVLLHSVLPQIPPVQEREQQSPGLTQAVPAILQKAVVVQLLVDVLQAVGQHSAPEAQALPEGSQVETGAAQRWVDGLQYPPQHSPLTAQATSLLLQVGVVAQSLLASQ